MSMRTERVTLEVTRPEKPNYPAPAADFMWAHILRDVVQGEKESVRVVPTPTAGIVLTDYERGVLDCFRQQQADLSEYEMAKQNDFSARRFRQTAGVFAGILARDAAAKAGAGDVQEEPCSPLKCDDCGAVVTEADVAGGGGVHRMETPDSAFTSEEWTTLCPKCNGEQPAPAEPVAWGVIQEGEIVTTRNTETDAKRAADGWYEGKIVPLYAAPPNLAAEVERLRAECHRLARDAEEYRQQVETARGKLAALDPIAKAHAAAIAAAEKFNQEQAGRAMLDRTSVYHYIDALEAGFRAGEGVLLKQTVGKVFDERDALASRVAELEARCKRLDEKCGEHLATAHREMMMRHDAENKNADAAANWLTAEEREAIQRRALPALWESHTKAMRENRFKDGNECRKARAALESLLARSAPPSVVMPKLGLTDGWTTVSQLLGIWNKKWLSALAAAGVAVRGNEGGE